MVEKKLILILVMFLNFAGFTQTDCNNYVNTDHTAPTNDALPPGAEGIKYLNGFNWFPLAGDLYDDYPCTDISFGGVTYPEMHNIMLNSLEHYDYITSGPLPLTENGWELLLVNLGRYPDDVTPITAGNFNYGLPYIVLYNRYSGTIRVFVNFGLDHTVGDGADAIEISLKFQDISPNKSGILRLGEGQDQALNETTDVKVVKAVGKAPAFAQQWASADFKIAYDPCTCYYPSFLRVDVKQVTSSTIELYGRSITLENEALVDNDNLQFNPTEFLNGFNYSDGEASDGYVMHKTILKMIEDYTELYEAYNQELVEVGEHNKKVKRNLAILKLAKTAIYLVSNPIGGVVPAGAALAVSAKSIAELEAAELPVEGLSELYQGLGPDITDWYQAAKKTVSGLIKANEAGQDIIDEDLLFKIVKTILGEKGKTFIANNFELKDAPTAPTVPTATFSEMRYEGILSDGLEIGGTKFYSPGSYGSEGTGSPPITSVYEYPVYNEVLGTFALLKSPKVVISKTLPYDQENILAYESNLSGGAYSSIKMQRYQSWTNEYQIQLAEDLKYAINDVLDVKDYNVRASFNIIAKNNALTVPSTAMMNVFHDPNYNVNIDSDNTTIDETYTPIVARPQSYHYYAENPDFSEDPYLEYYTPPAPTVGHDTVQFQTPYLPIDAFRPFVAGIGMRNESITYNKQLISNADTLIDYAYDPATGTMEFDVDNPLVIKPQYIDYVSGSYGFEYSFEVELKLIVDIAFNTLNSDGQPNTVSHVETYKIDPGNIFYVDYDIEPDLAASELNISDYEEELYFEDIDFHGQEVMGCNLDGTAYECIALDKITINGQVSTSSGHSVKMKAGNLIEVINESEVSPEVILQIEQVLDFSHPMPNADQAYIRNFCKGVDGAAPEYLANMGTRDVQEEGQENLDIEENKHKQLPHLTFHLYPNPTNETAYLKLNQNNADVLITVRNLTGQVVNPIIERNRDDLYSFDFSATAPGIYFVTVSSNGISKTKRLIIQ